MRSKASPIFERSWRVLDRTVVLRVDNLAQATVIARTTWIGGMPHPMTEAHVQAYVEGRSRALRELKAELANLEEDHG